MRWRAAIFGQALTALALCTANHARAEAPATAIAADRLITPAGGAGLVSLEDPRVTGHLQVLLHLGFSTASEPVLLSLGEASGEERVLSSVSQVSTFTVSGAVELWRRVRLGLALPLHVPAGDRMQGLGQDRGFPPVTAGDLRLHVVWNIYSGRRVPLAISLGTIVTFPTGDELSFSGVDALGFSPRLLISGRPLYCLRLLGHVGGAFHQRRSFYETDFGSRLLLGMGLEWAMPWAPRWVAEHLRILGEVEGAIGRGDASDPPLELRGGARVLWRRWAFTVSAGGGIGDGVTTPGWRVTASAAVALWGAKRTRGPMVQETSR